MNNDKTKVKQQENLLNKTLDGQDVVGTDFEKMDKLVARSRRILFEAKTIRWLDFTPNRLVIDENKVELVYTQFLGAEQVFTMLIKDIKSVNMEATLFTASLYFEYAGFEQNPPRFNNLSKDDAKKARRIITGLIAAKEQKIDLSKFEQKDLLHKLEEIGRIS